MRFSPPLFCVLVTEGWVGLVTHGTDRALWALRLPVLEADEADVARKWLDTVAEATRAAEAGGGKCEQEVLVLDENRQIGWRMDERWDEVMRLLKALPDE